MTHPPVLPDPEPDRAEVSWFAALVKAREAGNQRIGSEALRELRRHGWSVVPIAPRPNREGGGR